MKGNILILIAVVGVSIIPLSYGVDFVISQPTFSNDNYVTFRDHNNVAEFWVDKDGNVFSNGTLITGGSSSSAGNITTGYLVKTDGSNVWAINGSTGIVDFESSNATTIITNAFNNLKAGRDFSQNVIVQGEFTLTDKLVVPSFTNFIIQGKLNAGDGLNKSVIENIPNGQHIKICCGIVDGNRQNQNNPTIDDSTIDISNVKNIHVHDLTVLNGWTAGIRTDFTKFAIIENNRVEGASDDCIAINENTEYSVVTNNIVSGCGYGNKFGSPNGIEIQDGAHDITATNNVIRSALNNGIEVSTHSGFSSPYNIVIAGNTITNVTNGIQLDGESDSKVSDVNIMSNNIFNITNTGVAFSYAKGNFVTGNYFNITDNAINIFTDSTHNYIQDNFITQSIHAGIQVESVSSNNYILDNIVVDSGTAGSGNRVGINLLGDNNLVKGNLIRETGNGDTRNGITIGAGSTGNVLIDNYMDNIITRSINDLGGTFTTQNTLNDYWDIDETRTVIKTADESVTSSTTLQDDDHLTMSIGGDESPAGHYLVVIDYLYDADTTPDIKTTISTPAGTTGYYCEDASGIGGVCVSLGTTVHQNSFGIPYNMRTTAFIETDGTSGSVIFQWAQQTSNALSTSVLEGSLMSITRLS